jgi:hypothetical protein
MQRNGRPLTEHKRRLDNYLNLIEDSVTLRIGVASGTSRAGALGGGQRSTPRRVPGRPAATEPWARLRTRARLTTMRMLRRVRLPLLLTRPQHVARLSLWAPRIRRTRIAATAATTLRTRRARRRRRGSVGQPADRHLLMTVGRACGGPRKSESGMPRLTTDEGKDAMQMRDRQIDHACGMLHQLAPRTAAADSGR